MMRIFEMFNGKKTIFGAVLLVASLALTRFSNIWELHEWWIPKLAETLEALGTFVTTGGLAHKAIKNKPADKKKG